MSRPPDDRPPSGPRSLDAGINALQRHKALSSSVTGFALICFVLLALAEVAGIAAPLIRTILVLGLAISGTAAIVIDARRICAHCGTLYGYHLRIVHADKCRKCGEPLGAVGAEKGSG